MNTIEDFNIWESYNRPFSIDLPDGSREKRIFIKMVNKYCKDNKETKTIVVEQNESRIDESNYEQFTNLVFYFQDDTVMVNKEDYYDMGEVWSYLEDYI